MAVTRRERRIARAAAEIARLRREWPGMTAEDAIAVNRYSGLYGETRTVEGDEERATDHQAFPLRDAEVRRAWRLATEDRERS